MVMFAVAISSVYPSGAAFATASKPMLPEAPERFSTIDRLPQHRRQLVGDDAPENVGGAARGIRHDHANGPCRIVLSARFRDRDDDRGQRQHQKKGFHSHLPLGMPFSNAEQSMRQRAFGNILVAAASRKERS